MNNGKFRRRPRHFHTRSVLVLVSLVLVIATAMGATLAFLITNTGDVKNAFTPSQVTSLVVEDEFHGETKSNVKIQNTGDIDAYIRAEVIVTWKSADGTKVLPYAPVVDTDYTIDYGTEHGWFEIENDYWYYPAIVDEGDNTENLIDSAHVVPGTVKEDSDGTEYFVSIEILSSAIQSVPVNAVQSAWPAVQVVDGQLKAK